MGGSESDWKIEREYNYQDFKKTNSCQHTSEKEEK